MSARTSGRARPLEPLRKAAEQAIVGRLLKIRGRVLGPKDRARVLGDVLVLGIGDDELQAALADFADGDGGELRSEETLPPKLHSAYSSAGLALNTFAHWRLRPQSLRIGDESGFTELRFEVKLAIFDEPVAAPNLDLVLRRHGALVLGIESKLTEFLQPKTATFSDRYDKACEKLAHPSWRARYDELLANPARRSFLDGAQLVKHYLGMKRHLLAPGTDSITATLVYLYWEPADAGAWPQFATHRVEVAAFAAGLADPRVKFLALSYPELWASWLSDGNESLREHVGGLRARYNVALGYGDDR